MIVFLLLIGLLLLSSYISGKRLHDVTKPKLDKTKAAIAVEDIPRFCPPHKWFYQEVKDLEGNFVKWRMVCELCGPLKPIDAPRGM